MTKKAEVRMIEGLRLVDSSLPILLNEPTHGTPYVVKEIKLFRDGLSRITNVNHQNPAAYKVTLVHPDDDKDVKFLAVPYHAAASVLFSIVEEDDGEEAVVMSREG